MLNIRQKTREFYYFHIYCSYKPKARLIDYIFIARLIDYIFIFEFKFKILSHESKQIVFYHLNESNRDIKIARVVKMQI